MEKYSIETFQDTFLKELPACKINTIIYQKALAEYNAATKIQLNKLIDILAAKTDPKVTLTVSGEIPKEMLLESVLFDVKKLFFDQTNRLNEFSNFVLFLDSV